jgi:GDPmannose 4,6-dehydratase
MLKGIRPLLSPYWNNFRDSGSTCLIIGGSSQDGQILTRIMSENNINVVSSSRTYRESGKQSYITLDPLSAYSIDQCLQAYRPAAIFHLSAQSSVSLSFNHPYETSRSNDGSLLVLLDLLATHYPHIKLFYPLSSDIYGDCECPATEETPTSPISPYGMSKVHCLDWIRYYRREHGVKVYGGILSNHESQYRAPIFVTHKLANAAIRAFYDSSSTTLVGDLGVIRDWGWAEEYMLAALEIVASEMPDDYIIATGKSVELGYLAKVMFDSLGLDMNRHLIPDKTLYRSLEIRKSLLSPAKIKKCFGIDMYISAEEVARRLVTYYLGSYQN